MVKITKPAQVIARTARRAAGAIDDKAERTFQFYTQLGQEEGRTNAGRAAVNHTFLATSVAVNKIWQPAYYGALALCLARGSLPTSLELSAMGATAPALAVGAVLTGAWNSEIGTPRLLWQSLKESRYGTVKKLVVGNLWSIALGPYYYGKLAARAMDAYLRRTQDQPENFYPQF